MNPTLERGCPHPCGLSQASKLADVAVRAPSSFINLVDHFIVNELDISA